MCLPSPVAEEFFRTLYWLSSGPCSVLEPGTSKGKTASRLLSPNYNEEMGREGDGSREKPKGERQGRRSKKIRLIERQRAGDTERKLCYDRVGKRGREERTGGQPSAGPGREGAHQGPPRGACTSHFSLVHASPLVPCLLLEGRRAPGPVASQRGFPWERSLGEPGGRRASQEAELSDACGTCLPPGFTASTEATQLTLNGRSATTPSGRRRANDHNFQAGFRPTSNAYNQLTIKATKLTPPPSSPKSGGPLSHG